MTRLDALLAVARGEETTIPVDLPPPFTARRVPPSGPRDARIAVVGEAPGTTEVEEGQPFCGKSGQKLRKWIRHAGLRADYCYFDNVYPFYPLAGKITNVEDADLVHHGAELLERLRALPDLRVIVPTGNVALKALLGFEGITKHRGSIYDWEGKKVIPCIHPAAVLRGQTQWERRGHLDWLRIADEAQTPGLRHPKRTFVLDPAYHDVAHLLARMDAGAWLSLDIETKPSEGRILCVGFSVDPGKAYVFPWNDNTISSIKKLCGHPCDKVLWNHAYDLFWLRTFAVPVNGHIHDGMQLLHTLMPTDNVGLAYATSILTREPYYKDESKDQDDKTAEENWERFLRYCGTDAAVTLEITRQLHTQVDAAGLASFHAEHYEGLYAPILDTMLQGVRIDHEKRTVLLTTYLREAREKRDALMQFTGGQPLFALTTQRDKAVWRGEATLSNPGKYRREDIQRSLDALDAKTVSGAKLRELLYGTYGIPAVFKRRDSGDETETIDIFTLRKLRYDYRDNADVAAIIDLAIAHTRQHKLASFLTDNKFDEDGRMRFSLKMTTETGRLASSASPRGRKVNSQNIPREKEDSHIRSIILPEAGHVVLQCDGSVAEGRVCFARTKDPEMVRLARLRATEYDQHRHTGVIVGFAPTYDETPENFAAITKEQRQVSKNISHGAQRSLQAATLAQTLLRDDNRNRRGELFTEEECDVALERYHKRFPPIRQWHARVRNDVRRTRCLVNSWGRIWPVPYDQLSDDLWRRAYSWYLQSEIADWLNQWGFRAVWAWIQAQRLHSRVMLQEHDGLVLSCPVDEVYDVALFLRDSLEQEWAYDGVPLSIPVEFKVGPSWGEDAAEWKDFPTREEMERVAQTCVQPIDKEWAMRNIAELFDWDDGDPRKRG